MKAIDAYLSRMVQELWPDSIVYKRWVEDNDLPEPEIIWVYWIERGNGEQLGLGADFKDAKLAVEVLKRRETFNQIQLKQEEPHGPEKPKER